jgi:cytochrome c peroxidase
MKKSSIFCSALCCVLSLFLLSQTMAGQLGAEDCDFYNNGQPSPDKVELGRMLFFDKILSGNRNISCATCHHPLVHTGDGLSLSIGEGGKGLSVTRVPLDIEGRVPRNAPALWNLGAKEFVRMFHDGRVEVSDDPELNGFRTPAGADLPQGLDNVLAAQAMFPVTSVREMAGLGEAAELSNEIADPASVGDFREIWDRLALRLQENETYVQLFIQAYPEIGASADITFVHAANAMAAFEAVTWRADNSPFDRYLRGDEEAMTLRQKKGMLLFYGRARCATCHKGTFQTDHEFHAIAMPQIGPGRGGVEPEDIGRGEVMGPDEDYKFRTPSLRNVELNGPWGHDGAYNELEAVVRHHLNPPAALQTYERNQAVLPSQGRDFQDFTVLDNPSLTENILEASDIDCICLSDYQASLIVDFLHALTDPASLDIRSIVPSEVPSKLIVAD